MNHTTFGYVSGVLEGIGALPYLYSILNGQTKPSRATWLIWSMVGIILFITYYLSGARETLWQPGIAVLFNLTFATLSLKYGVGGTTKLDILCFIGVAIALFFWAITSSPVVGMTIIVIIATIGSIPTILKVYKDSQSENKSTWLFWVLANIANLLAIKSWSYEIIFYPIESTLVISFIYFLLIRKK